MGRATTTKSKGKSERRHEYVPNQLGMFSVRQAHGMEDLPTVPCPVCDERHTEQVDKEAWECPECGHEWRPDVRELR